MNRPDRNHQNTVRDAIGRLFVVYGMPRTGTTYLYHALAKHPGIFVSYRKESMFFSVNFAKGFEWYRSLFAAKQSGEIAADINPMYFMDDASLHRILDFDPDIRFVLGIREPVSFAISLYGNILAHGLKPPDILTTMRGFDWPLTPDSGLYLCLADQYISRRISEVCQRLGDQVLIYDFDQFSRSPLPVLRAIESFLGLAPYFDENNYEKARINASGRKNVLGFNWLVTNQRLLETAYRILPDRTIRSIRARLERMSVANIDSNPNDAPASPVSDSERVELEAMLAEDSKFYRRLFAERPILAGSEALSRTANHCPDGSPLPHESPA